jgi:TPR repeat protein
MGVEFTALFRQLFLSFIEDHLAPEIHLADCFDIIAGTSTGGITALGLAMPDTNTNIGLIPKYRAKDILKLYQENGEKIFPDAQHLGNVLNEYFGDSKLSDALAHTIITTFDLRQGEPYLFDSIEAKNSPHHHDFYMRDVARATSAVPPYFPAVKLKSLGRIQYECMDDGINCNNPTLQAHDVALKRYPNATKLFIVSLGTGEAIKENCFNNFKNADADVCAPIIPSLMMEEASQITHDLFALLSQRKSPHSQYDYYRFDCPPHPNNAHMDNASPDNVQKLIAVANKEIKKREPDLIRKVINPLNEYAKMHKLSQLSARGDPEAQYKLALLYINQNSSDNRDKIIELLQESAAKSYPLAQYMLGKIFAEGLFDISKNDQEALAWFRKAADQEHIEAKHSLGWMYEHGRGFIHGEEADKEAMAWYRKAADQGHINAQYNLGLIYANGRGGVQGEEADKEAIVWYRKAAVQGHVNAQYNLGLMYANGRGGIQGDQADKKAMAWYNKAADQGDENALYSLGWMYEHGRGFVYGEAADKKAVACYQKAADKGNVNAMYRLGLLLESGRGSVLGDQAQKEAMALYRKAAKQGHVNAQFKLGLMYADGRGGVQGDKEAIVWYRKAADQGHEDAQNQLGLMLANGRGGVKGDQANKEAVAWFRKAADQGKADAQNNLALMLANGRGVVQSDQVDKEAVAWFRKAADQGNAIAQFNLGWMYEHGRGVVKNINEAIKWYKAAANQGNDDARIALIRLGTLM